MSAMICSLANISTPVCARRDPEIAVPRAARRVVSSGSGLQETGLNISLALDVNRAGLREYVLAFRNQVSIHPLPLTSIEPRFSNTNGSRRRCRATSLTWILPAMLCDCIRLAEFTTRSWLVDTFSRSCVGLFQPASPAVITSALADCTASESARPPLHDTCASSSIK